MPHGSYDKIRYFRRIYFRFFFCSLLVVVVVVVVVVVQSRSVLLFDPLSDCFIY